MSTTDQLNIKQFHPFLQDNWNKQITAYKPINSQPYQQTVNEEFIDWDDPYRNIRFWTIVDFFREFKLTK